MRRLEKYPFRNQHRLKDLFRSRTGRLLRDVKLLKRSTPEFDDYAFNAATKRKFEPATKRWPSSRRTA